MTFEYYPPENYYEGDKEVKKEDILKMLEWSGMQPHLPKLTEIEMIIFMHSCYFNQEAAKKCVNNFWTARTHIKEIFGNYDINYKEHAACMDVSLATPLRGKTDEGNVVFYTRLMDAKPELFNFNSSVTIFDMCAFLYGLKTHMPDGSEVILDLAGGTISHLLKINPMTLKKVLYYVQEAIPVRLKAVHFVNPPSFMDKIVSLLKPLMKKELIDLVQIHSDFQSLHKVVPKNILPIELEGTADSVTYYHEEMKKFLVKNNDVILDIGRRKVDETKRPGKPTNINELFGVEGTFKKLDID